MVIKHNSCPIQKRTVVLYTVPAVPHTGTQRVYWKLCGGHWEIEHKAQCVYMHGFPSVYVYEEAVCVNQCVGVLTTCCYLNCSSNNVP